MTTERWDPEGDGFGWVIEWEVGPYFAKPKVYEVTALCEDFTIEFERAGAESSMDLTTEVANAKVSIDGFIKWDGCSEFRFEEQPHWCGPRDYKKHFQILEHLYRRACELMRELGGEPLYTWEDE